MNKAVELAKKFEGDWVARMKMALKMAWALIKKGVGKMKGTDKQVKWAEDIKKKVATWNEWTKENILSTLTHKNQARLDKDIASFENHMDEIMENDEAAFWINNFKNVRSDHELNDLFAYTRGLETAIGTDSFSKRAIMQMISRKENGAWMKANN